METIQVDNDVFAHLQKHARPFIDTPNSTLRRLLEIDKNWVTAEGKKSAPSPNVDLDDLLAESLALRSSKLKKAPKADLSILVKKGTLQGGQKLYLVDYKGNKVNDIDATISNNRLLYNNQTYSMSDLAEELLKKIGYVSNAVRGPAHWVTDGGKSIRDLWLQHLSEN